MEQELLEKARAELEESKKEGGSNLTIEYRDGEPTVVRESEGPGRASTSRSKL